MNYIKYIFSFNTEDYYLHKISQKFPLPLPPNPSRVLEALYVLMGTVLLIFSPILFLFCNSIVLFFLALYKKIDFIKLLIINMFFIVLWGFFFSSYMYLLTEEPSVPLYCGDRIELNPRNLVLIVGYSLKFPSIYRSIFLETLVILYMMAQLFNSYPTLFFFI